MVEWGRSESLEPVGRVTPDTGRHFIVPSGHLLNLFTLENIG